MKLFYFFVRGLLRIIFACGFGWRICNRDNVPKTGPLVVASNHASFLDPPLLGAASRRDFYFLARESLFHFPIIGSMIRSLNCIPVDRDGGGGAGLKAVLDRLRDGRAVVLFPEGTRSPDGKLQPARSGIGLAVIKSGASVLPARVFGSFEAWGRNRRFPKFRPLIVTFGRPLNFDALRAESKNCSRDRLREIYQQVADEIMTAIISLPPYEEKISFP